jgi:hypothetical protein
MQGATLFAVGILFFILAAFFAFASFVVFFDCGTKRIMNHRGVTGDEIVKSNSGDTSIPLVGDELDEEKT